MGQLVSPMNDQVSNIRNPGEGVSEDDDRVIVPKQRVAQQQKRTRQAQPPKRCGHNHPLKLFRGVPLDKKTGKENRIAQPANHLPAVRDDAENSPLVPRHVRQPVHAGPCRAYSARSFSIFSSSPPRPFMSRKMPFLSPSHIVGMLLMPYCPLILFCHWSPAKYCGQAISFSATNLVRRSLSRSRLMPTISNPFS